jgi:hypothetical protein
VDLVESRLSPGTVNSIEYVLLSVAFSKIGISTRPVLSTDRTWKENDDPLGDS